MTLSLIFILYLIFYLIVSVLFAVPPRRYNFVHFITCSFILSYLHLFIVSVHMMLLWCCVLLQMGEFDAVDSDINSASYISDDDEQQALAEAGMDSSISDASDVGEMSRTGTFNESDTDSFGFDDTVDSSEGEQSGTDDNDDHMSEKSSMFASTLIFILEYNLMCL